jgi:hypothetical protein
MLSRAGPRGVAATSAGTLNFPYPLLFSSLYPDKQVTRTVLGLVPIDIQK